MSHKLNIKVKSTPPRQKSYEEAALPDKPSPQHTVLITCANPDKRKRWVKPQDAWQVKLCVACRDEKKAKKLSARLVVVRQKAEAKVEVMKQRFYIPRLQVLKFIWPTAKERAAWPRVRRIWA